MAKRIMLVEDDPSLRRVISLMLGDWGCHVTSCGDGFEALEVLPYLKPDLIISDLDMPLMSGIEFFKKCRAISGDPPIPFVIMSGIPDAEKRLEEIRGDLLGFYRKPVPIRILKQIALGCSCSKEER